MAASRYWQDLTAPELARRVGPDSVAVMVLGAIEQHGDHLPLSTDLDIGEGLLDAALGHLPEDAPLLILPPLTIGASPEHASFAGTLSLPPQVAIATLEAIGDSLARAGVRRLVLLNGHGGNNAVMAIAALTLRRRWGMLVVKYHYVRSAPPSEWLPVEERRHGLHGGALETALMLHLAPHKVHRDRLGHPDSCGEAMAAQGMRLGPEGEAAFAWLAEDLHPAGVVGNAALATPELGKRLAEHYASRLASVLEEARHLSIESFQARPDE